MGLTLLAAKESIAHVAPFLEVDRVAAALLQAVTYGLAAVAKDRFGFFAFD